MKKWKKQFKINGNKRENRPYQCLTCNVSFTTAGQIKKHPTNNCKFFCKNCNVTMSTELAFSIHAIQESMIEARKKRIKSRKSPVTFPLETYPQSPKATKSVVGTIQDIESKIKKEDSFEIVEEEVGREQFMEKDSDFMCDKCYDVFRTKKDLEEHMDFHEQLFAEVGSRLNESIDDSEIERQDASSPSETVNFSQCNLSADPNLDLNETAENIEIERNVGNEAQIVNRESLTTDATAKTSSVDKTNEILDAIDTFFDPIQKSTTAVNTVKTAVSKDNDIPSEPTNEPSGQENDDKSGTSGRRKNPLALKPDVISPPIKSKRGRPGRPPGARNKNRKTEQESKDNDVAVVKSTVGRVTRHSLPEAANGDLPLGKRERRKRRLSDRDRTSLPVKTEIKVKKQKGPTGKTTESEEKIKIVEIGSKGEPVNTSKTTAKGETIKDEAPLKKDNDLKFKRKKGPRGSDTESESTKEPTKGSKVKSEAPKERKADIGAKAEKSEASKDKVLEGSNNNSPIVTSEPGKKEDPDGDGFYLVEQEDPRYFILLPNDKIPRNHYKCVKCKRISMSISDFNTHLKELCHVLITRCSICSSVEFEGNIGYYRHFLENHHKRICRYCFKYIRNPKQFDDHILEHLKPFKNVCKICLAIFDTYEEFNDHLVKDHLNL